MPELTHKINVHIHLFIWKSLKCLSIMETFWIVFNFWIFYSTHRWVLSLSLQFFRFAMIHQIHCHGYVLPTCIYDDRERKYYVSLNFRNFSVYISRGFRVRNYVDDMVVLFRMYIKKWHFINYNEDKVIIVI